MIVQYQNSKCSVSQQIIAFWDVKLKTYTIFHQHYFVL
jgi:hypothetical protein